MPVARLVLTDFRNHAALTLQPGPGFNILTGENGAGKTNILEALSLLAPGRGLRGAAFSEMARKDGSGQFGVMAELDGVALATGIVAGLPGRRLAKINGASAVSGNFAEWISPVWLTPAMDRLFAQPASDRRRFLDRLVLALDPAHARHASRYEAAMRQRNRILAGESAPDPAWLAAVEAQMVDHGRALDSARENLVGQLNVALAAKADPDFPQAYLVLEGWCDGPRYPDDLARGRSRDAAAGRTLAGPHRSDLAVRHLDRDMPASACSTGEQKALLISMILAHADLVATQTGRRPVLLLDEIAAHLDPRRRAALFERLGADGGQVWITGTEPAPFAGLAGRAWMLDLTRRS